jgi:hypothetical protein
LKHVSLIYDNQILLPIIYLFLVGAAIFDALESQTEDSLRLHLDHEEKRYKEIYNITNDEFIELEKIINKFNIYKTYPQWKFVGAFYFSLTVVTTIGKYFFIYFKCHMISL